MTFLLLALALAAPDAKDHDPGPACADGDLLACLTAMSHASRRRAWAASDEPMPLVRRYDVEAYAAQACLLGEPGLCGFAEPAPERLWRHLPADAIWLPGDPIALPNGGWTVKHGEALGFAGHRFAGDVVGTGDGLLIIEDGALVLHDAQGPHPVAIPGSPSVCRMDPRAKVVRLGFTTPEGVCDRGTMVLDLLTGKEATTPLERRRPRSATIDDGSVVELTDEGLVQRTGAGETVRTWAFDTSLPQHLLPHPNGLSVAVVQATGSLILPLVEGFGGVEPVPDWLPVPEAAPVEGRVTIDVPPWARTICELSDSLHDRPMRDADAVRLDANTLSIPDRARGMTLLASSSPSGCTDGTAQDAARWPPTADTLAMLTPSSKAFRDVERRVITVQDEDGQPVVGLPMEVKGHLPYEGHTGLDGTFLWWDEGGSKLVVADGVDMPAMKAERWELPASPSVPGGKPAPVAELVGLWRPARSATAASIFLSPDDVGRGWTLLSPNRLLHIASTRRERRVLQCRGCEKPTVYEKVVPQGSLTGERFVGGAPPATATTYTTKTTRPNLHHALPQHIANRLQEVGATNPDHLDQPGGPLLASLSGRTFEKGERVQVSLVAHGTTFAATGRYDGKEDCGAGKMACGAMVMEIFGGFERWLVEPQPLRIHRITRRDDRGEVVEVLEVEWN